jgi:hypothetical protein
MDISIDKLRARTHICEIMEQALRRGDRNAQPRPNPGAAEAVHVLSV